MSIWNVNQWDIIGEPRIEVPVEGAPLLSAEDASGSVLEQGKTMIPSYAPGSYCVKTLFGWECVDQNGNGFVTPQTEVYIPAYSNLTNAGTGAQTTNYTSTSRHSVYGANGVFEVDEGVELLDGTEVQTVGEFHGSGGYLDYGNPTSLQVFDELNITLDLRTIDIAASRTPYSKWNNIRDNRGFYSSIDTSGRFIFNASDDGTFSGGHRLQYRTTGSVTLADSVEIDYNQGNVGDKLQIWVDGVLQTPTKLFDDPLTGIYDADTSFKVGTTFVTNSPFEDFVGSICCVNMKVAGVEVLNVPMNGSFNDQPTNDREPLPVTIVGKPTLLGVSHKDVGTSEGYNPQQGGIQNLVEDSETPDDQTATVLNATEYTLSCLEGEATAVGFGTASPGKYLTFTTTSTSVSLTFVDAKYVNLELGALPTKWVPTHGGSYTTAETTLTSQSPLTQAKGLVAASFSSEGTLLETTGNDLKVEYTSGNLIVSYRTAGGIETFQTPMTLLAGEYKRFLLDWEDDLFKLFIEGVKEAEVSAVVPFVLDDTDFKVGDNAAGTDKVEHIRSILADSDTYPEEQLVKMSQGGNII